MPNILLGGGSPFEWQTHLDVYRKKAWEHRHLFQLVGEVETVCQAPSALLEQGGAQSHQGKGTLTKRAWHLSQWPNKLSCGPWTQTSYLLLLFVFEPVALCSVNTTASRETGGLLVA